LKRIIDDDPVLNETQRKSPELRWVDGASRLLDTRFKIPGTKIRFGADFLLGLLPGAGDFLSMGLSGLLIATMAKQGASPKLVVRMLLNVAIDTIVGSIPILGNLFDLFFKANYRNLELMQSYNEQGKHRGRVWPLIVGIILAMTLLFIATAWLLFLIFDWLASFFAT